MADDWEAQAIAQSRPVAQAGPGPSNDWEAQAIAQSAPVLQASKQSDVPVAQDVGASAITGLGHGLAGIAGLPGDIANWVARHPAEVVGGVGASTGVMPQDSEGRPFGSDPSQDPEPGKAIQLPDTLPGPVPVPLTSQGVDNFIFPNGAPYKPQTGLGKFAETAGEVLPGIATGTEFKTAGALGNGAWDIAKALAGDTGRVLLPTLGAAGGGEAADALGLPKPVGEIAGMLAVRAPGMMLPNAGRMIKDRLGDLSPEDIAAAKALQASGKSVGVPLMGQESFNNLGLTQLSGDVAASPTGSPIINSFLTQRTPQIQAARNNMLDTLGPNIGPQQAGDIVNQAADQRLRDLGQMRTDVADPGYTAARPASIPDAEAQRLEDSARTAAAQAGAGTPARSRLTALADSIRDNGSNIGLLDSTRKSFRDNLTNTALPDAQDSELRVLMRPVLDDMRDTMATHNQDFANGLQASKEAAGIVDQVKQSPVGQVMATTANPTTLTGTIGPTQMNGPEVRGAFNELALSDPNAPSAATRLFARNNSNVPATPTAGWQIANALMGKPDTAENFQAMMRGSEFASGQMPGTVSGPVNDTLNVFDATRRAPTIGAQTAGRFASNQQAGASPLGSLFETPITEPGQHIGQWIKSNIQRKTYADLAAALTSPNSVDQLLNMARLQGITPAQRAMISAGVLGAAPPATGQQ